MALRRHCLASMLASNPHFRGATKSSCSVARVSSSQDLPNFLVQLFGSLGTLGDLFLLRLLSKQGNADPPRLQVTLGREPSFSLVKHSWLRIHRQKHSLRKSGRVATSPSHSRLSKHVWPRVPPSIRKISIVKWYIRSSSTWNITEAKMMSIQFLKLHSLFDCMEYGALGIHFLALHAHISVSSHHPPRSLTSRC